MNRRKKGDIGEAVMLPGALNDIWSTHCAQIARQADEYCQRIAVYQRIERGSVAVLLLFMGGCAVWWGVYGLSPWLLGLFCVVSVAAMILALVLSRQAESCKERLNRLMALQTWATGTLVTPETVTHLYRARKGLEGERVAGPDPAGSAGPAS